MPIITAENDCVLFCLSACYMHTSAGNTGVDPLRGAEGLWLPQQISPCVACKIWFSGAVVWVDRGSSKGYARALAKHRERNRSASFRAGARCDMGKGFPQQTEGCGRDGAWRKVV